MFNPLVDSFSSLSDSEVEEKVQSLSRKYFQTRNPDLQLQIASILNMYREELKARSASKLSSQDPNSDLDNLIKIS